MVTDLTYICIIYMLFLTDSYWIWKEIIFLWINQKQCHKLYVTDWIYFPLICNFSPTPIGFGKREFALWINQKQCHKLLVTNLTYICIIYMLFLTDSYWIWKEIIFLWINQKQCHKLLVTDLTYVSFTCYFSHTPIG